MSDEKKGPEISLVSLRQLAATCEDAQRQVNELAAKVIPEGMWVFFLDHPDDREIFQVGIVTGMVYDKICTVGVAVPRATGVFDAHEVAIDRIRGVYALGESWKASP